MLTLQTLLRTFDKIFRCLCSVSKPDKKGMCKVEKVELLWQERDRKGMDEVQEQSFELLDFLGLAKTEIETVEEEEEDEFFGGLNVFSEQDVENKNII